MGVGDGLGLLPSTFLEPRKEEPLCGQRLERRAWRLCLGELRKALGDYLRGRWPRGVPEVSQAVV